MAPNLRRHFRNAAGDVDGCSVGNGGETLPGRPGVTHTRTLDTAHRPAGLGPVRAQALDVVAVVVGVARELRKGERETARPNTVSTSTTSRAAVSDTDRLLLFREELLALHKATSVVQLPLAEQRVRYPHVVHENAEVTGLGVVRVPDKHACGYGLVGEARAPACTAPAARNLTHAQLGVEGGGWRRHD